MKFYRTYLIAFRNARGLKYYAGKHVSKYENPTDDPYTGSGKVIKSTVKKYGLSCISSIEWFDHTKETLNDAEIALIAECKEKYGDDCVNYAKGGEGGCMHYATDEQKAKKNASMRETWSNRELRDRQSAISKESQNRPEVKAKQATIQKEAQNRPDVSIRKSDSLKKSWSDPYVRERRCAAAKESRNRPEVKAKTGASSKAAHAKPEVKAKHSAAMKASKRTSPVWHGELYQTLWSLWLELGMPKYKAFRNYCKNNGVTDLPLQALVKHFNERYQNEQLQQAA